MIDWYQVLCGCWIAHYDALRRLTSLELTASEVWQLDLFWGIVVGGGGAGMGAVLSATVANRWFIKQRGLASWYGSPPPPCES